MIQSSVLFGHRKCVSFIHLHIDEYISAGLQNSWHHQGRTQIKIEECCNSMKENISSRLEICLRKIDERVRAAR